MNPDYCCADIREVRRVLNKAGNWIKRRALPLAILTLAGFGGINAMAFMHARAMVEFNDSDTRTKSPEDLDVISKIKVLFTGINLPRPANKQTPASTGLPFETHRYQGSDDHMLEAWHIPADRNDVLMILFHGYGDSKDSLLPTAKALNELGVGTLLVDFFGSGGSTGDTTTVGYVESGDVTGSYLYATENWPHSQVILYGYSMGGAALLRSIAVDGIKPDGIIIEATYDRMLSTVKNRFTSMGIPATPLAQTLIFWGGWHSGFDAFKHNPADYVQFVTSPALVLHGHQDPRVTPDQAETVFQQLQGWRKFSSYPSAGHKPVLKTDPQQWYDDVNEFISVVLAQ